MTKMKWNYTLNTIMNISGIVCQLFLYFASKQSICHGQLLKVNNACMLNFLTPSADQCGFSSCWHLGQSTQKIKYYIHWIPGREVVLIKLLYSFWIFVFQIFTFLFYWSYRGGGIICYCPCLGFRSHKKAMPISVIGHVGYCFYFSKKSGNFFKCWLSWN